MAILGFLIRYSLPGLVLTVLSSMFFRLLLPVIMESEITKQVRLVEGTDTWNKWKEAPIPIYLTFYVQSVVNPDEVENGLTPAIQEKGPYSFLQKRKKVGISQPNGENTVKYKEVKTFFFDQEHSGNNTEEDVITIPNIPLVAIIHTVKKMVPIDLIAGLVGNVILNGEPLMLRNVTVKEILFQGFDVTKYTKSVLGSQLPKEFSGGRFGLFKGKNGTAGEEWEIYTGVDDPKNFGQLKSWNGKSALGFWKPLSDCDKLVGSDGAIFPPFITKETVLNAFAPDICRSMPLVYEQETEFLGIAGYRFVTDENSLQTPTINPANECYCMEAKFENCDRSGVLPLESCLKAPIFASAPHFLWADEQFFVESGQEPADEERHKTFIDVEPHTGLILRARKRLQFGLEIRKNRRVRVMSHLTKDKIYFPMLWAEESAEIDDNLADFVKGQLTTPLQIASIAELALLGVGIGISVLGAVYSIIKYFQSKSKKGNKINVDITKASSASSVATVEETVWEEWSVPTRELGKVMITEDNEYIDYLLQKSEHTAIS